MQLLKMETEYCAGIDLHWDNMYVCILDADGEKLVHRKLRNDQNVFRRVIAPYAHSITVALESTGTWYWVCDLCADMDVRFALGHAQYMKWIHGAKAKHDRLDAKKIARIILGGNLFFA
jgi:transposase